jgi:N-acetylmuramoyl-L-alanine amidase
MNWREFSVPGWVRFALVVGIAATLWALTDGPRMAYGGGLPYQTTEPELATGPLICVDPGHSIVQVGATVERGGVTISEESINWRVAEGVIWELRKRGYRVISTRPKRTDELNNYQRSMLCNQAGADLLLRIHANAGPAPVHGVETFYPTRQGTDPQAGVVGPSPQVIKRSRELAVPFHRAFSREVRGMLGDRGLKSETKTRVGAFMGALGGSIHSRVPAITVEMGFMTNSGDLRVLRSAHGQRQLADAIVAGVEAALPVHEAP